jgi:hypothetical protein
MTLYYNFQLSVEDNCLNIHSMDEKTMRGSQGE